MRPTLDARGIGTIGLSVILVAIGVLVGGGGFESGTYLLIIIASLLISSGAKSIQPFFKTVAIFILVIEADLLSVLLYEPTKTPDDVQWHTALFVLFSIPIYVILLIGIVRDEDASFNEKLKACLFFPELVTMYLVLFALLR